MKKSNKNLSLGMSMGMCIGISLGMVFGQILFDNIGVGMCIGLAIGMSFGMAIGAWKDQQINAAIQENGWEIQEIRPIDGTDSYSIILTDSKGTEKTVEVSATLMEAQAFCIGDTVLEKEDGSLEQVSENED